MSLYEKLPELKVQPLLSIYDKKVKLSLLSDDEKEVLIRFIFTKMSIFYNKKGWFGDTREKINFTILSWKSGLCDLTVQGMIAGLYDLLDHKTNYVDYPPTSPMQFHRICTSVRSIPKNSETKALDEYKPTSKNDSIRRICYLILKNDIGTISKIYVTFFGSIELLEEDSAYYEETKSKVDGYKKQISENGRILR